MIDKDENRSAQDSEKEINVRSRPRFFAVAQQAYDSSTDIDEKYVCQICFETRKVKAFETFKLKNCGHPYCKICLSSYVAHKVAHGEVYPVCFISIGVDEALNEKICGCVIEESDIDTLLYEDSTSTMKYQRFKMSKENSNLRFCSKCEGPRVGSFDSPAMTCSNCGHKYCFVHGDAHDSTVMCVDYELAIAEESGKTKELLELTTKPCPNCKSPIEKAGGCNQMKCYNCNIHFCWLCGKKVDDGTFPAHFEWWNVAGCPNRQMEEQGATERSESRRICVRVVSIFQVFFLGPPAFVLTVVSSILCCCFLPMLEDPPMQIFSGCMTIWGYVVMAVLLFPFVIAFGTPILIGLGMVWCASTGYIRLMEYIASLKPSPPPFRAGTPMPVNPISRRSQFFDTSPDLERGLGANSV